MEPIINFFRDMSPLTLVLFFIFMVPMIKKFFREVVLDDSTKEEIEAPKKSPEEIQWQKDYDKALKELDNE